MGEPPSNVGAVYETVAVPTPAVAVPMVGAPGTIALDVGLIATPYGLPTIGINVSTMLVDVLITETVLAALLATYANVPAGLTATPIGVVPTDTGLPGVGRYIAVSNTRTVLVAPAVI